MALGLLNQIKDTKKGTGLPGGPVVKEMGRGCECTCPSPEGDKGLPWWSGG